MKRLLIYGLVVGLIAAAVFDFTPALRRRFSVLQSDVTKIRGDTGDVMASATYQRFAARREAVGVMREALVSMAAAESAFVADSGHPTSVFLEKYRFPNHPDNLGPTIEIQRDRWIARVQNNHTTITCSLTAMFDTVTNQYDPGTPVCEGWSPEESVGAVATTEPDTTAPRPRVIDRVSHPGPVNNKPPRMPWVLKGVCPDGNCRFGQWTACSTVVVTRDTRQGSPKLVTLRRGDEFTALSADAIVERPGLIGFRNAFTEALEKQDATGPVITIFHFTPADTLYPLVQTAAREVVFWFRGAADTGADFWRPDPTVYRRDALQASVLIRAPQWTSWVKIRDVDGREGWSVYDAEKMARTTADDVTEACLSEKEG